MTGALEVRPARPRLTRSDRERMLAGVCGGLAEHFSLDPLAVRLAYVLISLFSVFPGILAYIVLMFLMPPPESGRE